MNTNATKSSYRLLSRIFPGLALLFVLSACYENVEGCLDVNAANYDLDADVPCPDDCCTFPNLGVEVNHFWQGEALRTDTFYRDAANNEFRFTRLRYYWSELTLRLADGSSLFPQDSVEAGLLGTSGDTVFQFVDDNLVLLASTSSADQSIGVLRVDQAATGLDGTLGLTGTYRDIVPSTLPSGHALNFQDGQLHIGSDTAYLQLKLEYDLISGGDTIARAINVPGSQSLSLDFGGGFTLPRGFDIIVSTAAETATLLNGLDLSGSDEELATALATNAVGSWFVVELRAE